jgi:hypothetical protein
MLFLGIFAYTILLLGCLAVLGVGLLVLTWGVAKNKTVGKVVGGGLAVIFLPLSGFWALVLHQSHSLTKTKTWENKVVELDGGNGGLIKITETVTRAPYPTLSYSSKLTLHYHDGQAWKEVDHSDKPSPVYSKLYTPDNNFVEYRPYEPYTWSVFVDPGKFSIEDYKSITNTIGKNLDRVNLAIRSPREPKERETDNKIFPTISSAVYKEYDFKSMAGEEHSVNMQFSSPDSKIYLSQYPTDAVTLMLKGSIVGTGLDGKPLLEDSVVGEIEADQKHIQIRRPPKFQSPTIREMVGEDWMGFYKSLTNSHGKNIFDYYEPVEWKMENAE